MLTASGGPFRGPQPRASWPTSPPSRRWPTRPGRWARSITINSATLVNKGLEVIEAHLLFGIPFDRIEVVVHPTSVVHSMVEFVDGSTLAQAEPADDADPDRARAWPGRTGCPTPAPPVDWTQARRPGSSSPSTTRRSRPSRWPARRGSAAAPRRRSTTPPTRSASTAFLAGRLAVHRHRAHDRSGARPRTTYPRTGRRPDRRRRARRRRLGARRGRPADRDGRRPPHDRAALHARRGRCSSSAILVSIGLHELGHMVPAKKFGGKVTQYFIGFGRTVWSKQVGETEYGVKAIPLGGYVKIVGMLPPGAEGLGEVEYDAEGNPVVKVRKSNTGMFTQLISDARAAEWEHDRAEDDDRLFYKMPWWKKVIVMAAGPIGEHPDRLRALRRRLRDLRQRRVDHDGRAGRRRGARLRDPGDDQADRACTAADPVTPGRSRPGCRPGDRIVELQRHAGHRLGAAAAARSAATTTGTPSIAVRADGERAHRAPPTPPSTAAARRPTTDQTLTEVGFLGVAPDDVGPQTGGPLYALDQMGDDDRRDGQGARSRCRSRSGASAEAIVGLAGARRRTARSASSAAAGSRARSSPARGFPLADKAVFAAPAGRRASTSSSACSTSCRCCRWTAGTSPARSTRPLRRGVARLRGRPDPGYVDVAKLLPVAYVVAACHAGDGRGADLRRHRRARSSVSLTPRSRPRSTRTATASTMDVHDLGRPGHARRSAAGARPAPQDPPDQGRQGAASAATRRSPCSR